MSYSIAAVTPPRYAQDGSRGYSIEVVWHWLSATHGPQETQLGGWVDRTATGEVIATYDGYPWRTVGQCDVSEWSADWVRANADQIVKVF